MRFMRSFGSLTEGLRANPFTDSNPDKSKTFCVVQTERRAGLPCWLCVWPNFRKNCTLVGDVTIYQFLTCDYEMNCRYKRAGLLHEHSYRIWYHRKTSIHSSYSLQVLSARVPFDFSDQLKTRHSKRSKTENEQPTQDRTHQNNNITILFKTYPIMPTMIRVISLVSLFLSASAFVAPNNRRATTSSSLNMADFSLDPKETAFVFIEYQNEFTTEGGKLHDAVKDVMDITGST